MSNEIPFHCSNKDEILAEWNIHHTKYKKQCLLQEERKKKFSQSLTKKEKRNECGFRFPELEIRITEQEERALLIQNQIYVKNILPDPQFYVFNPNELSSQTNLDCINIEKSQDNKKNCNGLKKKRMQYNAACYVCRFNQTDKTINCILPEGTKLIKPRRKLVELVAEVIYNSPDGVLQVQQIYSALQKKYPYFLFMNKDAINSWKSSIRHALFQKWFFKLKIHNGKNYPKSSYWGLNTASTPKEWTMPGNHIKNTGILAQSDILTALTLISCFQHTGNCYSTPFKISSKDLIELNRDDIDQLNQSPKILKLQNICQITPTKLPCKHFPMSTEKQYDPVLSGASSCIVKKCLDVLYEDEKENYQIPLNSEMCASQEKTDQLSQDQKNKDKKNRNHLSTNTSLIQSSPHKNDENLNYPENYNPFDFSVFACEEKSMTSLNYIFNVDELKKYINDVHDSKYHR